MMLLRFFFFGDEMCGICAFCSEKGFGGGREFSPQKKTLLYSQSVALKLRLCIKMAGYYHPSTLRVFSNCKKGAKRRYCPAKVKELHFNVRILLFVGTKKGSDSFFFGLKRSIISFCVNRIFSIIFFFFFHPFSDLVFSSSLRCVKKYL